MSAVAELLASLGLDSGCPRILVVEDNVDWLQALASLLRVHGATVDEFVGAEKERNGTTTFQPLIGEPVALDLSSYDAAFLDHYFVSRTISGASLIPTLRAAGCDRIVAMSSDVSANARMSALGASTAIRKQDLMAMLLDG